MKIAVNTRFLIHNKIEGIGRFTMESLKRLVLEHPEHEFVFFFDRPFHPEFIFAPNVSGKVLTPPARHPFLFIWYFEWSITRALKAVKADIFISCDGFLSLQTSIPQISIIHDLAFEHYPEDVSYLVRKYYHYYFPRFAKKAARICTVSEFSKQDICKTYGIAPSNIDVVYNGASSFFHPIDEEIKRATKAKYSQGYEYFVYVGALQPRKNIRRLLLAFDAFKSSTNSETRLLIVGRMAWKTEDIESTFNNMKHKDSVLFTGRIPDEALAHVFGSAQALTYVPYLEGFGIPILEAMQCGTPVITSNTTAMPEVAGNAGILVNPLDIDAIAEAMKFIDKDATLRMELSKNGLQQAQKFSWEKTAQLLWESVEKVIKQ